MRRQEIPVALGAIGNADIARPRFHRRRRPHFVHRHLNCFFRLQDRSAYLDRAFHRDRRTNALRHPRRHRHILPNLIPGLDNATHLDIQLKPHPFRERLQAWFFQCHISNSVVLIHRAPGV
jgi:mRNA-degrading endonuclease YafQ of YafQ-DinJ toxin-antitoxin module